MKKNVNVAGFCIGGPRSLLYRLRSVDSCYIVYRNNLSHFLKFLQHDKPNYIIGLRTCASDPLDRSKKIVIPTCFSNENGTVSRQSTAHTCEPLFLESELVTYSDKPLIGISNDVSYAIASFIESNNIPSRYTLLQIPKVARYKYTASVLDSLIYEATQTH